MSRVAIRATYKTETVYNEGYICIDGDTIEGVFGLDYVKIDFSPGNSFFFILYEMSFSVEDKQLLASIKRSIYESQKLYVPELCSPEDYLLFGSEGDMNLSLIEVETDIAKIKEVFESLEKVRL